MDQVFYDWDFDNQLKSARLSHLGTSHEMAYRYDVDGLRIEESVDGESTRFLFDTNLSNPEVVLEYRPSGLITASYVRGRKIISQSRQGVDSYYLADGLGSIRSLMNSSGQTHRSLCLRRFWFVAVCNRRNREQLSIFGGTLR